ncbi:hypothetical protein CFter6_5248 [Collimonas fungivorans]|uniref:Uncharacterized protein n=1 Tax=Collimonas fungivorans TaxID=158899 RepID=A0A127PJD5_9BURK|nr:hypothetical protein CFter6_5248 [Collimonas fungivorans]
MLNEQHAIVAGATLPLLGFEPRHLVEDRSEFNLAIRSRMDAVKTHRSPPT